MKHYLSSLVVFAAVLSTVLGCRRVNPDQKQPAVQIQKEDWITPSQIADKAAEFPKVKRN